MSARTTRSVRLTITLPATLVALAACSSKVPERAKALEESAVAAATSAAVTNDFATRYAAAWSGKDPVKFGAFYAENGKLIVNGAESAGRAAIVETARSYMAAFPDMKVTLDSLREENGETVFHWRWTGTNTGPGGTGRAVDLHGYERWTIGADGLIEKSDGHFDDDEYQRQVKVK